MDLNIEIIDPLLYPDWDTQLLASEESTFFHSHAWCNVLTTSYGYKPNYFLVYNNGNLSSLIPFMEINTPFSPKRGISLPFSDYCRPILSPDKPFNELLDTILKHARDSKWKFIELRGGNGHFDPALPSTLFYVHNLDLRNGERDLLSSFRSSTKRNIKKAIKENVQVKRSNSFDSVRDFFRLNCLTRRNHGLPPQPFYFFKNLHKYIIAREKGFVVLATYKNKIIAGAIFFHFNKKAIYKYGASDKAYQFTRANNLVMWEAIKWYALNGYSNLSLGRTKPDNKGLLQFKRGWGTQETALYYHKYDIVNNKFIEDPIRYGKLNRIATKLPLFFLRLAGSLMYKHVG